MTDNSAWQEDEFEDAIARGLTACFEKNVVKVKSYGRNGKLPLEALLLLRSKGPFFASPDRIWLHEESEEGYLKFDLLNDPLPSVAVYAQTESPENNEIFDDPYVLVNLAVRADKPGKYFVKQQPGALYCLYAMAGVQEGLAGIRHYFTVTPEGTVSPCDLKIPETSNSCAPGHRNEMISMKNHEPHILQEVSRVASIALQTRADQRFQWRIRALEQVARCTLGCQKEEVKSLLYARSLPMTATGRKRPILHLVAAHARRMKNGTDIDITSFLRGTQEIEMSGTLFKVMPPRHIQPQLSKNSRRYYA